MQVPISGDLKFIVIFPFTGDWTVVMFVGGGGYWPLLFEASSKNGNVDVSKVSQAYCMRYTLLAPVTNSSRGTITIIVGGSTFRH